jgi:predicted transcriptional regulator of viral defense system
MNLYQIKNIVDKQKRKVYSTKQLSNLLSEKYSSTRVYMHRLVKKDLAIWIKKGVISFVDNNYIIASQLIEPSYISLYSSLFYFGLVEQQPNKISVVNTKNSFYFKKQNIYYHKIKPDLFFGYKTYDLEGAYINIANVEKAVLDALYYNVFSKKNVVELKNKLNYNLLKKYSLKYPKRIKKLIKDVK